MGRLNLDRLHVSLDTRLGKPKFMKAGGAYQGNLSVSISSLVGPFSTFLQEVVPGKEYGGNGVVNDQNISKTLNGKHGRQRPIFEKILAWFQKILNKLVPDCPSKNQLIFRYHCNGKDWIDCENQVENNLKKELLKWFICKKPCKAVITKRIHITLTTPVKGCRRWKAFLPGIPVFRVACDFYGPVTVESKK